jgi:hypothetical protein
VQYLLTFAASERVTIQLAGQADTLTDVTPIDLDLTGLTVREAIDAVIERRRGVGWTITTNDVGGVFVEVFTVLGEDLATDTITIPKNDTQKAVDIDRIEVQDVQINRNVLTQYDAIEARGERVKVITTMQDSDSTLSPLWSSSEESSDESAGDEARRHDQYRHVYTGFYVPDETSLLTGDANPTVQDDGTLDGNTNAPVRPWGHVPLRQLPLQKPWGQVGQPEFVEPFAVVQGPDSKYHFVDRLDAIDIDSAQVRPLDAVLGLELLAPVNHVFAKNHWGGNDTEDPPQVDYTTLRATLAVETDQILRYREALSGPGVGRDLFFDVPGAEAWWIASGTVTGIADDGTLQTQGSATALRNDRERLKSLVALAKAWYEPTRSTLFMRSQAIELDNDIGTFLTGTISGDHSSGFVWNELNSVVTERVFDYQRFETLIRTHFSELDLS